MDIREVTLEDVRFYCNEIRSKTTPYTTAKTMQGIRCFMRHYKKTVKFNPELIKDDHIEDLPVVEESAILEPMKSKNLGRPPKTALIKAVKELRDNKKMTFRAIAKELTKDVSQVHVWYKYKIPANLLDK